MNEDTTSIVTNFSNTDYSKTIDSYDPIVEIKNNFKDLIKIIKDIHLRKEAKVEKIKDVYMPPELFSYYRGINYKYIMTYEFGEEIVKFVDVMNNNFSASNLIILYNNINELKIRKLHLNDQKEHLKNIVFGKGKTNQTAASYNEYLNRISVSEKDALVDLPHELFHMSSSFYDEDKNVYYSGFSQRARSDIKTIGNGFNEGYTELMVFKYFGKKILSSDTCYKYLFEIANNLETIVGKDKMEHFYLTANLKGLVDELTQYVSHDDVMKFIAATDYLLETLNNGKKKQNEKDTILEQLRFVNIFIIVCATRKTVKLLSENKITADELGVTVSNNIGALHDFTIRGEEYNATPTPEQEREIIVNVLKNCGIGATVEVERKEQSNVK